MDARHIRRALAIGLASFVALFSPAASLAQSAPQGTVPPAQQRGTGGISIGIEAFGGAGVSWPAARESFEASGLESRPTQFGGGARVTNLWKDLFAEVAVSRWSDTGERVFIDSTGERFPLGIPLDVKATYVDVSAGWKSPVLTETGRTALLAFVGAGAGVAMYEEASPFAEAGEDVDERGTSWNAFAGVEFPILRWLAVGLDGRYRYVPDLIGDDGVSGALGDDSLGGFQMSLGLRVGFGGRSQPRPPATDPTSTGDPDRPRVAIPGQPLPAVDQGTIVSTAPVYLLPDTQRIPLRQLEAGTTVRVLEEAGSWIRIEFRDPQFGPRIGYVERKFVQIKESK